MPPKTKWTRKNRKIAREEGVEGERGSDQEEVGTNEMVEEEVEREGSLVPIGEERGPNEGEEYSDKDEDEEEETPDKDEEGEKEENSDKDEGTTQSNSRTVSDTMDSRVSNSIQLVVRYN